MALLTDEQLCDLAGSTFPSVRELAQQLIDARDVLRLTFSQNMVLSNTDAAVRGWISDQIREVADRCRAQLPELQPPGGGADDTPT